MISEREVHSDVRDLLMSNRPFQYAHLIKFERPSTPDSRSGKVSTSYFNYVYLTDASRNIIFDDRSINHNKEPNGPQTYLANKVLSVSGVQESVEAKADNFSLTLDGSSVGGVVLDTVSSVKINGDSKRWRIIFHEKEFESLRIQGFKEGDKIELGGAFSGTYNIESFRANNILQISKIEDDLQILTDAPIQVTLESEEIKSILLNKNRPEYASFINREVYIYRAYFEDGQLVGQTPDIYGNTGPLLLFKGIINNVSFEDDDNGVKVTWGLTSHWGDFTQVVGRVTSDEFHRALDANGIPQPESAIKAIYAYDKGFMHSDTSLNLLAKYTVMVEKTNIKSKKGFLGFGAKTKVKTTMVPEERSTPLDFQLQAKSIPIVYGVRNVTGIPIFADTLKSNSSEVYVVHALSEGQIGGIYDIYIEGKSLICNNQEDFDARSRQPIDETVELICRGRADRGDVLAGVGNTTNITQDYYYDPVNNIDLRDVWGLFFNTGMINRYQTYNPPPSGMGSSTLGQGVIHGQSVSLTAPQKIVLDFYSGTDSQKAASNLVSLAQSKAFKVQNDYWTGNNTSEYWGPNHRLLDTAYVVSKISIEEGETTIPDLEFVIRGKVLECFNYDKSYAHHDKMTSENPNNFLLGDMVELSTGQTVQIIDKWTFVRPDGVLETRCRFSEDPELREIAGVPEVTEFYMTKGANRWTMTTFNFVLHEGSPGAEISTNAVIDNSGSDLNINYPTNPNIPIGGDPRTNPSPVYSVIDSQNPRLEGKPIFGGISETNLNVVLY